MKKLNLLFIAIIAIGLTFSGCKDEGDDVQDTDMSIPQNFKVDIPSSMSSADSKKSTSEDGFIKGDELYENLRTFINVGEEAATVVEDLMKAISTHDLSQELEFTFNSNEDGREKSLKVKEGATFGGESYQFQLDMMDNDGTMAIQIFWNNSPVKGTAIVSPYDFNRNITESYAATRYQVDYSEAGDLGYDKYMRVYISGFPQIANDRFGLDNLKMFVGKTGDELDIYGNSNHPDMWIFDLNGQVGYDWAFHGRANTSANISVAEVAIPPSMHATTDGVFEDYSLYKVLGAEFHAIYDSQYPADLVEAYLQNVLADAVAPAYFNQGGFVAAGQAPEGYSTEFINISSLVPFIPKDIAEMQVNFATAISK